QLAGKPSLIDPDRITAKANSSKGPLQIPDNEAQPVAGELVSQLEELYKAYSVLVAALAADRVPTESETNAVLETAKVIRASSALPPTLKVPVSAIVDDVAHLHHMTLREAREKFKGISKAILQLASSARGDA